MQINWSIYNLDRRTSDGFVTTAHWQVRAIDGEHSAFVYSVCSWSEGEPNIAYADLTIDKVLEWVWESVDKDAVETALASQIESQKNPVQTSGVPW